MSLFTGAGGGELGAILNGWHTVGYVEWDEYCQRVLAQRIKDGILPEAPIFGDVRAFISEGYAEAYKGMVDVISAGFPCQPFSVAGRREGEDDPRNMWPGTIECLRTIRPRFAFLENVPGLLATGYCGTIFRDLAEAGFDARWCVLGARHVKAPHQRDRLWILAYPGSERQLVRGLFEADGARLDCEGDEGRKGPASGCHNLRGRRWWTEPDVGRVADGVAYRVDRLKAIGNGQVPAVVRAVWRLLGQPKPKEEGA